MHSNVVANLPMTFVANLPKLWRTFQFLWRTFLWRTFPVANLSDVYPLSCLWDYVYDYTRRQINLYRMFFADFSVNSQPILMKFCKDYFLGQAATSVKFS